ncbi:Zinc metalloproteinase nas-4 [Symbiodinium microadriaticum]|uniref:Metalloendopeptidase n=1 Tax=Symbiodinium microadriaticum TaxID=2951 RepID=A0A1Q9CW84_SYMMI|nr:Zinc metalloproteinase nas-4 [Symbiodinium microadriaticum]
MCFFRLLLVAGATKVAAMVAPMCLRAQAYGDRGQPSSTSVDAETCQSSCAASNNCRHFTYDASTQDCWLLNIGNFLQPQETAISGAVDCQLQQEDEDRRSQRVLAGLNAAAQFVRDRTEDERIRKAAEHVKWSVNNGFLEEEVYQNVRLVLEEEAKLVSSPDALVEAVGQGAALTADDVDWLTRRMKGGDVFSDLEDAEAGSDSSFGTGTPWTDAKVKFCFDNELAPSSREALQCAMDKISKFVPGIVFVNVQYTGVDACGALPAVYMQSNGRRSGNGCWADIGMSTSMFGGNQKLNLQAPGCDNCGTATHEILHALGMAHEQQRPDRDDFVSIIWNNIKPGMDTQFAIRSQADTQRPYDIMSIMHYASRSFSSNGRDTLVVKPKGYELYTSDPARFPKYRIGQRVGMSTQDVSQLADLYGCSRSSQYQTCDIAKGYLATRLDQEVDPGSIALIGVLVIGKKKSLVYRAAPYYDETRTLSACFRLPDDEATAKIFQTQILRMPVQTRTPCTTLHSERFRVSSPAPFHSLSKANVGGRP